VKVGKEDSSSADFVERRRGALRRSKRHPVSYKTTFPLSDVSELFTLLLPDAALTAESLIFVVSNDVSSKSDADSPPLKSTSPRQSRGTLAAHLLWQLNLQSEAEKKEINDFF